MRKIISFAALFAASVGFSIIAASPAAAMNGCRPAQWVEQPVAASPCSQPIVRRAHRARRIVGYKPIYGYARRHARRAKTKVIYVYVPQQPAVYSAPAPRVSPCGQVAVRQTPCGGAIMQGAPAPAARASGGQPRMVFHASTNACPPGTTDQTDWSATPQKQPDGALRYPHVCK